MQDTSEGEGFLQQQTWREPTKTRALFKYTKELLFPKRQQQQIKELDEKQRDDDDGFEEIVLHEDKPRLWKNLQLRTFITSLTGLILTILSFVFGVGCGLGIGIPYYGGSSLSQAFSRPSSHNPSGIPDDLPIVPAAQLTNRTELDLDTGFAFSAAGPQVREYDFTITLGLAAPDGFWKPMVLVNGQSPGPLIEAATGDTVRVRVTNLLPNNATTSIHFHGIDQRGTPWMDGVAGVTQCGIPAGGGSWTYEFTVAGQRGTFWYHAHAAVQYTDGLYGPIVVRDPEGEMVPSSDAERIVFLGENHHAYAGELAGHYLAASSPWDPTEAGVEPLSDNLLINGQNTFDCSVVSTTFNSTFQQKNAPPCTGGQAYVTSIRPGTTMRLRLINHSSYLSYWFSIDGHPLTIVEIDGVEVEPIVSQGVHVNIGQRYSVIISATEKAGDYTIRSALEKKCFLPYSTYISSGLESIGYEARGILRYERDEESEAEGANQEGDEYDEGAEEKTTNPWGCGDMPFDMPKPVRQEAAYQLGEGDATHIIDFQFRQVGEINRIFLNKVSTTLRQSPSPVYHRAESHREQKIDLLEPLPRRRNPMAGSRQQQLRHRHLRQRRRLPQLGLPPGPASPLGPGRQRRSTGGHQQPRRNGASLPHARAQRADRRLGPGAVRPIIITCENDDMEPGKPAPPRHLYRPGRVPRRRALQGRQPGDLGHALPRRVAPRGRDAAVVLGAAG